MKPLIFQQKIVDILTNSAIAAETEPVLAATFSNAVTPGAAEPQRPSSFNSAAIARKQSLHKQSPNDRYCSGNGSGNRKSSSEHQHFLNGLHAKVAAHRPQTRLHT